MNIGMYRRKPPPVLSPDKLSYPMRPPEVGSPMHLVLALSELAHDAMDYHHGRRVSGTPSWRRMEVAIHWVFLQTALQVVTGEGEADAFRLV